LVLTVGVHSKYSDIHCDYDTDRTKKDTMTHLNRRMYVSAARRERHPSKATNRRQKAARRPSRSRAQRSLAH
jgi:hypothetical protein